jgi:hypothetical protein
MSKFKNVQEMDTIRAADAKLREKQIAGFEGEKNEYKDGGYFVVSRCVKGPFMGLFMLSQLIAEDGSGHPLKKPIRKVLIEGVDRDSLNRTFDKTIGKRYFR